MIYYGTLKQASLMMTTVAALAITGTGAGWAQSVHLKPPNSTPTFNDKGLTLEASGTLAGLGNGDILVTLTWVRGHWAYLAVRGRAKSLI